MKYTLAQLAFCLGATALVPRQAQTCVQLRASGGASGVLGQLSDGQNRIGGGYAAACYCLSNGGFTDANGRGCILTPPTTQFQCDTGARPTTGFAISSSGSVTYNGRTQFYACPVNDRGEWNVYSTPVAGQTKCVAITLSSAGSCSAGASSRASSVASSTARSSTAAASSSSRASSSSVAASSPRPSTPVVVSTVMASTVRPSTAPSTSSVRPSTSSPSSSVRPSSSAASSSRASSPAVPSSSVRPTTMVATSSAPGVNPTPTGAKCPADLNGNYQFPHLIVPVNSQTPSRAYGTSYFGAVNSTTCSIFNFDIPQSYSGRTCTLVFLFPTQAQLQTSSYSISGSGQIEFTSRSSAATEQTTYANQPSRQTSFGNFTVAPGNSYTIATGSCAAGQRIAYEACGSGSLNLRYFQDYNPSPIGLYIRQC